MNRLRLIAQNLVGKPSIEIEQILRKCLDELWEDEVKSTVWEEAIDSTYKWHDEIVQKVKEIANKSEGKCPQCKEILDEFPVVAIAGSLS